MNKYFYFIINLSISFCFNPLPNGNGILNSNYSHKSTDNLYFVFEHFRHGARSPCEGKFINKRDDLGAKWENFGALTNIGIKQQFLLGKQNREHYDNYISKEYNPKEIKIYSTNYNRTIMSAQAQILGFYNNFSLSNKPNFDDIIEDDNKIDDFNLNTIIPQINLFEKDSYGINRILFTEKFECKLTKKMLSKNLEKTEELKIFYKSNEIREKFNKNYIDIFEKEFNNRSYTLKYKGMYKFCDIYASIYFDEGRNKEILNNLEKKYNYFNSSEILDICYDYFYEKFLVIDAEEYSKGVSKILNSRTLHKLIKIMKKKIEKNDPNYMSNDYPKFLLYSAHDDTLTQMQIFLNINFNIGKEWVPFASNQIFELRKYGNIFYVEVYYNNKLKMNITFEQFEEIINKNIFMEDEINKMCYGLRNYDSFPIILVLFCILIITFIIFIILNVWIYLKSENTKVEKVPKIIMLS